MYYPLLQEVGCWATQWAMFDEYQKLEDKGKVFYNNNLISKYIIFAFVN